MSALMLPSIEVVGFRTFDNLKISGFGRINLIVGRNNVGKSSLLDGIQLFAAGHAAPNKIRSLLRRRDEYAYQTGDDAQLNFQRLFHASRAQPSGRRFSISNAEGEHRLDVALELTRRIDGPDGSPARIVVKSDGSEAELDDDTQDALVVDFDGTRRIHTVERLRRVSRFAPEPETRGPHLAPCQYVPARGMPPTEMPLLYDQVVLRAGEDDLIAALQIIEPTIERMSLIKAPGSLSTRIPLVRRTGKQEPETLKSMGDGMNRILEIALAIASARAGCFLVDEFENGVHYSVHEELWRFVFAAASILNTQVFATTHSWDCISAFSLVSREHPEVGALVRLERTDDRVSSHVFSERELGIIARDTIEVR
jgi:predicted ATPase